MPAGKGANKGKKKNQRNEDEKKRQVPPPPKTKTPKQKGKLLFNKGLFLFPRRKRKTPRHDQNIHGN